MWNEHHSLRVCVLCVVLRFSRESGFIQGGANLTRWSSIILSTALSTTQVVVTKMATQMEVEADERQFHHLFSVRKNQQIPIECGKVLLEYLSVQDMVRLDTAVGGHSRSLNSECSENIESRKREPSDFRVDFLQMLENLRSAAFDEFVYKSLKQISWALKRRIDIRNFEVIRGKDNEQGTLLHWSSRVDHLEIVRLLCTRSRVDVDRQKASSGQTAAFIAAEFGNIDCLRVLHEEGGADINIANNVGVTPLHRAAVNEHCRTIEYLVSVGAQVDATDYRGNTALHRAAYSRHFEACEALLRCGASTLARDAAGQTPLDVARQRDSKGIIARLMEPYEATEKDRKEEEARRAAAALCQYN